MIRRLELCTVGNVDPDKEWRGHSGAAGQENATKLLRLGGLRLKLNVLE